MRAITLDQLIEHGACDYYREQFRKRFGSKIGVTVDFAVAEAGNWDFLWLAESLLSEDGFATWEEWYNLADVAYGRVFYMGRSVIVGESGLAASDREPWVSFMAALDRAYMEHQARTFAELYISEDPDRSMTEAQANDQSVDPLTIP